MLGSFLRDRREAVTPAEVGLPAGDRRRTPGLRRAELAMLAGISVEYLTRLEQGRDRNPSTQVLVAVADALGLSADDRSQLRWVAKTAAGDTFCPTAQPPAREVRPTVAILLERLEPAAAVVLNRLGDVLASTEGYRRLVEPIGVFDRDAPNLLWFVFGDTRARTAYPDWDAVADDLVGWLKSGAGMADSHVAQLADDLAFAAGAAFADRWHTPGGTARSAGQARLVHPDAGSLQLAYESLDLADDDQRLLVYVGADDATEGALDRLCGLRPGSLRAVAG